MRLDFLLQVGLNYLSLSRAAGTLSGGEAQRIRLATQIGSGLTGVLYVLDEPSIGLHQRDNRRLIETLVTLRDLGNTLIVVEHDEETIHAADWVVDIGPGAGVDGGYGRALRAATRQLLAERGSITGDYLVGTPLDRDAEEAPAHRQIAHDHRRGRAREQPAERDGGLPARRDDGRHRASAARASRRSSTASCTRCSPTRLNGARRVAGKHTRVTGLDNLDKVVHVDQAPIGRTPRSNPATYTGVFDRIRTLFSETPEAKVARLPARPLQLQRQGRPLRGVRGRRHDQDRDELPARRLRRLRGVPRQALQPRHARGALQGQEHRRSARDADRARPPSSSSRSRRSTAS